MKGRHPQEGVGWWAERSCCFFHVSWRRPLKSRPSFPPRQPRALTFASLAAQCSCFCRAVENWHFPIEKVSICLQLQHEGVQGSGVQGPLWLHKLEFNFSYLRPWFKNQTKMPNRHNQFTFSRVLSVSTMAWLFSHALGSLDVSKKALKMFKDHNSWCVFQFVFSRKTSVNGLIC